MTDIEYPDFDEIYRYLGYISSKPDERIIKEIFSYTNRLLEVCKPAYIFAKHNITINGNVFLIANIKFTSSDLAAHLKGCQEAVILAATLGADTDRLIKKLEVTDMPGAVIVQAAAAALTEKICDNAEKAIMNTIPCGYSLTSRFSPGYGDLPVTIQPELLSLLDAPKKIGLSCTGSYMLTPIKSVTAFIGITEHNAKRTECRSNCTHCANIECPFRKLDT